MLSLTLASACLAEGRPLSEWEAEYAARLDEVERFEDVGGVDDDVDDAPDVVCSVEGGAPRQMTAENLRDDAILISFVQPDCEVVVRATIEPMTFVPVSTHVGHVWRFAPADNPDLLLLQHVVGDSNTLVFD